MKQFYVFMLMFILTSCSDNLTVNELSSPDAGVDTKHEVSAQDSVASLLYHARWGDGKAYLKLADCYKDGYGVKKDLTSVMIMTMMAEEHGGIKKMGDYFDDLPEDSEFKQLYLLINKHNPFKEANIDSTMQILARHDGPDARAILGIIAVEHGDTIGGGELIREAAAQGCALAELAMAFPDCSGRTNPDISKFIEVADRIPLVYSMLGDMYFEGDDNGVFDRKRAAEYYLLAEKHGLLPRFGTTRLLEFYLDGGDIQLSEDDVQRLKASISACESRDDAADAEDKE